MLYFNSIKVRLELEFYTALAPSKIFQFHKGTIRTKYEHYMHQEHSRISIP